MTTNHMQELFRRYKDLASRYIHEIASVVFVVFLLSLIILLITKNQSGFVGSQSFQSGASSFVGGSLSTTTVFNDDIPACFGTDCDWQVKYDTSGSPDVAKITTPPSSGILMIVKDAFKDFDYFQTPVTVSGAGFFLAPPTTTRNYLAQIAVYDDGEFNISAIDSQQLGLSQSHNGATIRLAASDSGALGGNGGNVRILAGSAAEGTFGGGGTISFALGKAATTTGFVDGYFYMDNNTDVVDFRFKNANGGKFKILDEGTDNGLAINFDNKNAVLFNEYTNTTPTATIKFATTSLSFSTSSVGIVMPAPDGTCYKLSIANGGSIATSTITCP